MIFGTLIDCLPKTRGYAGEFKKSFSVAYNRKTPFDMIQKILRNVPLKYSIPMICTVLWSLPQQKRVLT